MNDLGQILEDHGAVIMPTETVYGIFAKALSEEAVNHVYELKKRPRDKAMNLNICDFETILKYSKNQPTYLKQLYDAFLPGPLTIILEASQEVPYWINSGLLSVGFRMPKHPVTLDMIANHGPLIGPSANISGCDSGRVFSEIQKQFNHQVLGIEDDKALTGVDSTIIDLSGDRVKILRQGAITQEVLTATIPELIFEN
ncbi:TPA: threonylcarbamoyl-AMP synthase [Streptococcus agalactiae]|nr:threonylcarbamoyl-AMP synthase [Streptococcus agalactiae]